MYDYLIVGAGVYGATFARLATDSGKRCLVVDRREHLAGNCFDERCEGILRNRYGGHIFHTNSKPIWDFVGRFSSFSNYQHRVKVNFKGTVYSFPINLQTLHQLFGKMCVRPSDALEILGNVGTGQAGTNFETQVVGQVGWPIYDTFFRGYTKKQWGREPRELPASIAKRIPIRLTYDDRYFDDTYQGMPTEGYTEMVRRMLEGIEVKLNEDFEAVVRPQCANRVVFSGALDGLFGYGRGRLEYRSLTFEHETRLGDYQGCATMNYTDEETPYTRIIEWKHFRPEERHGNTIITREYPSGEGEPFYPINDDANQARYEAYRGLVPPWMVVGGRLGSYRYYNMDQVVGMAMRDVKRELM